MHELPILKSKTVQSILDRVKDVVDVGLPILITGETGTGKSYLARVIHNYCFGTDGLFQNLDCATFNPNLIESELFGHEKGAFTGASHKKSGIFELVCGGTLLLDEVENLSLAIQAKLLRVLDEKRFRRVGGTMDLETDFRLISTANVNLEIFMQKSLLRRDFYYRLAAFKIHLPPLRERPDDIRLFSQMILNTLLRKHRRNVELTAPCWQFILNYDWPGNVRELKNVLVAAAQLATDSKLDVHHFRELLGDFHATPPEPLKTLQQVEKEHIQRMLKEFHFNISKTARTLDIAENTLRAKMKKYKIKKPQ